MFFLLVAGQRAGLGPPCRLTFLLVQESKQRTPLLLPTPPSLRYGVTCAVNLLWLYGKTHFELRSALKHVAVKVMTMQLHSTVQMRATRGNRRRRGHKGQYRMRASFFEKLIAVTAMQISVRVALAGCLLPHPPVCLRLRHVVQAVGIGTEECQCIVR